MKSEKWKTRNDRDALGEIIPSGLLPSSYPVYAGQENGKAPAFPGALLKKAKKQFVSCCLLQNGVVCAKIATVSMWICCENPYFSRC